MSGIRVLGVLLLGVAACANTVSFMPLGEPPRQPEPRRPEEVDMFITMAPPKPYAVVGLVQSSGGWASEPEMIRILKQEGGKRGCEGMFLARKVKLQNSSTHTSTDAAGNVYTVSARGGEHTAGLDAYCIMYVDAPAQTEAAVSEGTNVPAASSGEAPANPPSP